MISSIACGRTRTRHSDREGCEQVSLVIYCTLDHTVGDDDDDDKEEEETGISPVATIEVILTWVAIVGSIISLRHL